MSLHRAIEIQKERTKWFKEEEERIVHGNSKKAVFVEKPEKAEVPVVRGVTTGPYVRIWPIVEAWCKEGGPKTREEIMVKVTMLAGSPASASGIDGFIKRYNIKIKQTNPVGLLIPNSVVLELISANIPLETKVRKASEAVGKPVSLGVYKRNVKRVKDLMRRKRESQHGSP